jgi:ABC-2 type transport system ATP-binding protein
VDGQSVDIVIAAKGLGARTRRGWIYREVSWAVPERAVGAVAGPAGSGRTSLLLAVAARMPFSTGKLSVCGKELPGGAGAVRERVAVARAGGVFEPEPWLRVRDHLLERGTKGQDRDERFDKVCQQLGLDVAGESLVGDLDACRTTLLSLALAVLDEPKVVLLDDLDRGVSGADQENLWERMRALTEDGITVLATTTDPIPAQRRADLVLELDEAAAS